MFDVLCLTPIPHPHYPVNPFLRIRQHHVHPIKLRRIIKPRLPRKPKLRQNTRYHRVMMHQQNHMTRLPRPRQIIHHLPPPPASDAGGTPPFSPPRPVPPSAVIPISFASTAAVSFVRNASLVTIRVPP